MLSRVQWGHSPKNHPKLRQGACSDQAPSNQGIPARNQWLQVSSHNLSAAGCRVVLCQGKRAAVGATMLKMKVELSAINCLLLPDVSPKGCKSWRRLQAGTCSVATYSWAEGGGVTHATSSLAERLVRHSDSHSREGITGKSWGLLTCNHLQGEPSFKYVKLATTMVVAYSFPLYVPGQAASSFNFRFFSFHTSLPWADIFIYLFFKLAKWLNYFWKTLEKMVLLGNILIYLHLCIQFQWIQAFEYIWKGLVLSFFLLFFSVLIKICWPQCRDKLWKAAALRVVGFFCLLLSPLASQGLSLRSFSIFFLVWPWFQLGIVLI